MSTHLSFTLGAHPLCLVAALLIVTLMASDTLVVYTPDYIGAVHTANAGLDKAVAKLEPLKANYPGASYADLYTLAGVAAIQALGGPVIKWLSFLPPAT